MCYEISEGVFQIGFICKSSCLVLHVALYLQRVAQAMMHHRELPLPQLVTTVA